MVKQAIIKFCYKAVEDKMLKIYAIAMTTLFFSIWIPTMFAVIQEMIVTFFS